MGPELGTDATVRLIVRDLDDEAMLKIMAADNDDAYNLRPAFILETVLAAKSFIPKRKNVRGTTDIGRRRGLGPRIAEFLRWPVERVESALAQLAAIDHRKLSKEALESLPSAEAATTLHDQVKKARKAGTVLSEKEQVEIARSAAKSGGLSPPLSLARRCPFRFSIFFRFSLFVFLRKRALNPRQSLSAGAESPPLPLARRPSDRPTKEGRRAEGSASRGSSPDPRRGPGGGRLHQAAAFPASGR